MPIATPTIAELTPEHLTAMLQTSLPGARDIAVTAVDAEPVGTGQMANSYRLRLSYANAGECGPRTVIAKLSSTNPTSQQMAASTGAYLREVRFYQQLTALTAVRAPRCYFAEISDDQLSFVLLLEDMGPAKMVEQLGGCTADEAALSLEQAAALHGPSWQHPNLPAHDWLPVESVWNALGQSIPHIATAWLDRFGAGLAAEQVAVVQRLGAEVPRWLSTLTDHRTLWHGDFRLDNLLFNAQGGGVPIAVVDWQSVAAAPGIIDVSYFLGNSLPTEARLTHERELVAEYHRQLLSYGVPNYSAKQCWDEYRAHAVYGLVLTIPVSMGVQRTERGDRMFAAMARRAADQLIALDSFAALDNL
jgi:aminoglycoside/choline kinase family phosphotransferase